ncbi:MAG TPA: DUF4265 domain-containing protein [Myxococcaceae bacterium]|nr:DUF4265 domain-containing protein [Myxococcaceae bacterium]
MKQDRSEHYVKVIIPLEQDEDGYPPVGSERLWALEAGEGRYKLDNIPFFARELALGDIASAVPEEGADEGILRYQQLLEPSGHSTFRVLVHDESPVQEVCSLLERLGCGTERSHLPRLVAIDIPPTVSLEAVRQALEPGRAQERWDYEESCLADSRTA